MYKNNDSIIMERINNIAKKVYRGNKNALFMLVNDLEEFFEMNKTTDNAYMLTSDEFDKYINNIING